MQKHRVTKSPLLLLTFFLLGMGSLKAQDSTLTFAEAVRVALQNDVNLQQETNRLDNYRADKASGIAMMTPSLSASGNYGQNNGNSFNAQEGRVVNGKLDFASGSIDASIVLFNGFNRLNYFRSSSEALEGQAHLVERSRETVIVDVAKQYLTCLLDQQLVRIAHETFTAQQEQFNQIQEMVKAGSRAEVDQINQRYQVKNAQLQELKAQTTLRNDKGELARLLLLDPANDFSLQEPTWSLSQFAYDEYEDKNLYEIAEQHRSDIKQNESFEQASKLNYKSTQGNFYPSLSAFYSYGSAYNFLLGTPDSVARPFDQQFLTDNVYKTYGLSIRVPIFNGLQVRNNVVKSRVAYENAKLDTRKAINDARVEVMTAYQNLQDAIRTFDVAETQLEAAEESYKLQKEQYDLQISNLVEFTQATSDLVTAKSEHAQAKYVLLFQDILMQYNLGTLSVDDIPE